MCPPQEIVPSNNNNEIISEQNEIEADLISFEEEENRQDLIEAMANASLQENLNNQSIHDPVAEADAAMDALFDEPEADPEQINGPILEMVQWIPPTSAHVENFVSTFNRRMDEMIDFLIVGLLEQLRNTGFDYKAVRISILPHPEDGSLSELHTRELWRMPWHLTVRCSAFERNVNNLRFLLHSEELYVRVGHTLNFENGGEDEELPMVILTLEEVQSNDFIPFIRPYHLCTYNHEFKNWIVRLDADFCLPSKTELRENAILVLDNGEMKIYDYNVLFTWKEHYFAKMYIRIKLKKK